MKSNPVTAYAESVLAGKEIAGRWVKMAAQRHVDDLRRKDIYFDAAAAEWIFRFFKTVLRLNGGQFEGLPFALVTWEAFIVGSLFGWKKKSDGFRRFRSGYVEIAKGNGKSPLGAGIGIFMLCGDKEARAECYAAAATKDQAMVSFRDAVAMRDQSPQLMRRLITSGTAENTWNLAHLDSGSWFRPISREKRGKAGPRPHFALCDELHEHPDSYVIDMLEQGFKFRRQPLLLATTNSGTNLLTVCGRYHTSGLQILKRTAEDDSRFVFIAGLDACDKHYGEGQDQPVDDCAQCDKWDVEGLHWKKANPNLGVTIQLPYIRDLVNKAKIEPERENTVKRLNFGLWTQQVTRYIPMDKWHACRGAVDPDKLAGRRCFAGLDFSNKKDLSCMALIFPPEVIPLEDAQAAKTLEFWNEMKGRESDFVAGRENFHETFDRLAPKFIVEERQQIAIEKLVGQFEILLFTWMPEGEIPIVSLAERSSREMVPYDKWTKAGFIDLTPGNVIDYDYIQERFEEAAKKYSISEFGYDPWNATQFALKAAKNTSAIPVELGQNFKYMSEPTKELLRLVLGKKIKHGGNPVLDWMMDNFWVQRDRKGNVQPDKFDANQKNDGVVAGIMALKLAIMNDGDEESVYATRGIRTL